MLQKTDRKAAYKRERCKEEQRQLMEQYQESRRDLLVLTRWPNTILAAFLILLALYGWVSGLTDWRHPWIEIAACLEICAAWGGWYHYHQLKDAERKYYQEEGYKKEQ
jgi:hypothetical protein